MKDFTHCDGDEPVNKVQKSWLRSLDGVSGDLATDRLDLQYHVKILMGEVTHATCGTLTRARRVVRYLVCKSRLAWSFTAATHLEYLDAFAEIDWALLCRDQTGTALKEFNDTRRDLHLQRRRRIVRSNSSSSVRHPTVAIPCRDRLPPSAACTQRFSRTSGHDDEAWIWPRGASRYQSTLVQGSSREGAIPTDERTIPPTSAPRR